MTVRKIFYYSLIVLFIASGSVCAAEMDHSKMDHSKMDHSKMDHSKMDHSKMDHSKMDHSKMDHSKMDHSKMDHSKMGDGKDHSAHMAMMNQKNSYTEKHASYRVPDVELLDQHGEKVNLKKLLESSEPYALNFIFTTCTTICPILTASFSHMQKELGPDADSLRLISISIDPEYDTPRVLKKYSERVGATKNWTFLTGDYKTIVAVERAFDSYASDKMNHRPAYLFKTTSDDKWYRVDGLASGTDLANIYQHLDLF